MADEGLRVPYGLRANANGGTDHGYGNPLLILGGPVNGRRFFGSWPGLNPETLSPTFGDVPVTTDYRRVFSEVLIRRMGNPKLSEVFPGYAGYAPLGIVQGTDIAPQSQAVAASASALEMPSSIAANSGTQGENPPPESVVPDWQRRGKVNRMITRRER